MKLASDQALEMYSLKEDVRLLKQERSQLKAQIKRLQLLANYALSAMREEEFYGDPELVKIFRKCDKASDLGGCPWRKS